MKSTDYYSTMEIDRAASGDDIKHAYQRLAKRFHPDVSVDPDGERKFKAVSQAYQTLKSPRLRAEYDGLTCPHTSSNDPAFINPSLQIWFGPFLYSDWSWIWGAWMVNQ